MTTNSDLIIYQENELYGLKDSNDNIIIPPLYKEMYPFSYGLSLVKNNKFQNGYINKENKLIVPFGLYSWCDPQFICGYARVMRYNITKEKDEWGIIDTEGNIIVPIKYDKIWALNERYLHSIKGLINNRKILINLYTSSKHVVLNGLKYIATYTLEEFKAVFRCTHIDVKVNPKTEELFFSYGSHTGYVALKKEPSLPVISVVTNSTGSLFLLLHEKKDTGKTNFERSIYKIQKEKSTLQKHKFSNTNIGDYEEERANDPDNWSDPYGDEQAYYDGWSREDVESGLADAYEK